jgi:aspartyl-tRNA(Asn)/glutamyl-tRNA(Gln) amidotransferase subunit C
MSYRDDLGKIPPKAKIDVSYVAKLAKLALSDEEIKRLGQQLNDILAYINKLNEINTKTAEPMSHTLSLENVHREDKVTPSLPAEEALKNAPSKKDNFFRVPKVIE